MTLSQQFAAYSTWRAQLSESLEAFRRWLSENELSDAQTDLRITQMMDKLREDRLNVAFVAEFSRGKSELINAIFFPYYGSRILPSTAGRTTMCPTELIFDPDKPPSIELLPIETRESNASISEYKRFPTEWRVVPLETESAEAMQEALRSVSEVINVAPEVAEKYGFARGDKDSSLIRLTEDGTVEIPRSRAASPSQSSSWRPMPWLRQAGSTAMRPIRPLLLAGSITMRAVATGWPSASTARTCTALTSWLSCSSAGSMP